jgi:hypothetical protein
MFVLNGFAFARSGNFNPRGLCEAKGWSAKISGMKNVLNENDRHNFGKCRQAFQFSLALKGGRFICHSRIYREAVAAELQKWSDKITSCTKG